MTAPASASTTAERAALRGLAAQARERAGITGAPALLCYAAPLPAHDPLQALQGLGEDGAFRFYWEQPCAGLALAAGGAARRCEGEGPQRFRQVGEQVAAALAGAVSGSEGGGSPGPFALGGFSFFDRIDAAHWPGFGAAQLVVPEWLTLRFGDTHLGLVTASVTAHAQPESLADALAAGLQRLRQATALAPTESGSGDNRAFRLEPRDDGRAQWLEIVRHARERIRAGRLSKVVLARALDVACEVPPSPLALLRRLRAAHPACYTFLVDPGAGALFLGATPERMARFGRGRVELAALAGTMPRGATPEADAVQTQRLLDSRKEREEHQIVVEGILAAVERLGHVEWLETPQVLRLPYAQHLSTPITLIPTEPLPLLSLLERLHPTAAVGGQPREEAYALIRDSERFARGWYGAPLGWMNAAGEGEFAVALRAGKLSGHRLQLFAGGGIVADSDPEREYEETELKFQPLLSALSSE